MGLTDFDVSWVRTQPIYYHPYRFSKYEIFKYITQNTKPHWVDEMTADCLQKFDDSQRSEYVAGIGTPIGYHKSNYPAGSYEHFMEGSAKIEDTAFLQRAITTGRRLLRNNRRTAVIENWQKDILLEFCSQYGLNRADELLDLRVRNSAISQYDFGCNVWSYIRGLEQLSITQSRMEQLLRNPEELFGHMSEIAQDEAKITVMCLYSIEEKKLKSFLYAGSLLDIAFYQLGKVMADGVLVRKCANPLCPQVIVGGRSDKKTCSNACRKALERYQKKRPQC